MGADWCEWVRWGVGTTGGHRSKVNKDKNGCAGHGLGPMAGEISPNIMFGEKNQKKYTDGSGWVHMGSHGCDRVHAH